MVQGGPGGGTTWVAAPEGSELAAAMASTLAEEDESLAVCMVCKEGYLSAPERLLAAYVFCTRHLASQCTPCAPLGSSPSQQVTLGLAVACPLHCRLASMRVHACHVWAHRAFRCSVCVLVVQAG